MPFATQLYKPYQKLRKIVIITDVMFNYIKITTRKAQFDFIHYYRPPIVMK